MIVIFFSDVTIEQWNALSQIEREELAQKQGTRVIVPEIAGEQWERAFDSYEARPEPLRHPFSF